MTTDSPVLGTAAGPRDNRLGALFVLGASLAFTLMAAAVKLASAEVGSWVVAHGRSVVIVALALTMLRVRGVKIRFVDHRRLLVRAVTGLGAMVAYFWAISAGPLADVIALQYTSPLFVAGLSPIWLGEAVARRTWGLLAVGFAGALVLLRPGGSLEPALLGALTSAVFAAMAYLTVRQLRDSDDPDNIVLFFATFSSVATAPSLLGLREVPSAHTLGAIAVVGLCAGAGQMLVTRAYTVGEAAVMSGVGYVAVPFGAVVSAVAFGEPLTPWSILGGVLVVASGAGLAASSPRGR